MNELGRDLAPRYVPTKFDRNRRRIAPGRALTGLCLQTDRRTISFQYTPLSTSLSGGMIIDNSCLCFRVHHRQKSPLVQIISWPSYPFSKLINIWKRFPCGLDVSTDTWRNKTIMHRCIHNNDISIRLKRTEKWTFFPCYEATFDRRCLNQNLRSPLRKENPILANMCIFYNRASDGWYIVLYSGFDPRQF